MSWHSLLVGRAVPANSTVATPRAATRLGLLCLALLASNAAFAGGSTDRRYFLGVHDIAVDDVSSQTFGVTAGMLLDKRTPNGKHLFGEFDLLWDHDLDHLDSDHIPIWWQVHAGSDGELWKISSAFHVDWIADLYTRVNTVSSIERQISLLPALAVRFDAAAVHTSLEAGVGYWFLEIDDDAPKERGYVRDDLRRTTLAESVAGDAAIQLGKSLRLIGRAQGWWDGNEWLYTRYAGEAHLSLDRWIQRSELVLDTEINEYNFDLYNRPGLQPILPWDDDLLIKILFVTAW